MLKRMCRLWKLSGRHKEITGRVKILQKPLIVKLTPNVTDIKEIAIAAEDAGADALSLINTILGMAIDIHRKRPILATIWEVFQDRQLSPLR